jgi:hypothetical protein
MKLPLFLRSSLSLFAGLTLVAGCGSRTGFETATDGGPVVDDADAATTVGDAEVTTFPLGAFTSCAEGQSGPDGNVFLNVGGFEPGAVLTLTQSGSTITATYVDENDKTTSFEFAPTTPVSANLASPGQTATSFSGLCVEAPENEGSYPATLTADTGTLTYESGTAFLSVEGTIEGSLGPCGTQSAPAGFLVVCGDGPAASPSAPLADASSFPVGTYSCNSLVDSLDHVGGITVVASGGGQGGTLTLTQVGTKVTAQYSGDAFLQGTLGFEVASATSALALPDQSLTTPCDVPVGIPNGATQPPESLPLTAASLAMNGSTLFLSFAGSMGASTSCPGAQLAGSVVCSKE